MAMRALLLPLLLLAAPVAAQDLAQLRPFASIDGPVVRLGDLFDGVGDRAHVPLGPAPAPGQRQMVEAAQLLAIARAQGVAWRPLGADRVVLERPARALAQAEILDLLRAALGMQGVAEEDTLELSGFNAPLVPAAAFVQLAIEQAALEPGGRFAATLAIAVEGMPTARTRVVGRVVSTQPMLVATRPVAAGQVLRAADVRIVRVPASRLRPGAAVAPEQVLGQALRRPAAADQPLMLADLSQPAAVARGAAVTMLYEVPGMSLTAQGRAMEAAPRGGRVAVMNLASRMVVEAEVIGPGRVRVGPGR
jgi:flagella basal body P-ring formation protein FlgA